MGRPPRLHYDGAIYHVISRGHGGENTFRDSADYRKFLESLANLRGKLPFRLLAYCLMSNHYHLLIQVQETALPVLMHKLLTSYAKGFNCRWQRQGHLFNERYKALMCKDDSYLAVLCRYIHCNPVKAGLVNTPRAWPWSSYNDYLQQTEGLVSTGLLLTIFGGVDALREFNESVGAEEDAANDDEAQVQDVLIAAALNRLRRSAATKHDFIEEALRAGYGPTAIARHLDCTPQAINNAHRRYKKCQAPFVTLP